MPQTAKYGCRIQEHQMQNIFQIFIASKQSQLAEKAQQPSKRRREQQSQPHCLCFLVNNESIKINYFTMNGRPVLDTLWGRFKTPASSSACIGAQHPSVQQVCKCVHRCAFGQLVGKYSYPIKQSPRNPIVFHFNNVSRTYLKYSVNKRNNHYYCLPLS